MRSMSGVLLGGDAGFGDDLYIVNANANDLMTSMFAPGVLPKTDQRRSLKIMLGLHFPACSCTYIGLPYVLQLKASNLQPIPTSVRTAYEHIWLNSREPLSSETILIPEPYPAMTPPTSTNLKIGILVPSSNTALEPLTFAILSCYAPSAYNIPSPSNTRPPASSGLPTITVHYARFPVSNISLSAASLNQFSTSSSSALSNPSPILAAARLLATAHVDVIGWSGTSGGWLGLSHDEALCMLIKEETGIKATTSTLGLVRALEALGLKRGKGEGGRRFGMVTPYTDDVQAQIGEVFKRETHWEIIERHLRIEENAHIAEIEEAILTAKVKEVAAELADRESGDGNVPKTSLPRVVSTFCTNLKAAHLVGKWEKEMDGVVVLDSVSTVVWDCLRILGRKSGEVKGWGRLFDLE